LERDRAGGLAARPLDLGEPVERVDVAREDGVRLPELALRGGEAAAVPVELAELGARPGHRLGLALRRARREQHRTLGRAAAAEQLAGVRDASVRGEARTQPRHLVEGAEGLVVAAELDERVADHAADGGGAGRERQGALAEGERLAEAVAGER